MSDRTGGTEKDPILDVTIDGVTYRIPQSLWSILSVAVKDGVSRGLAQAYRNCPLRETLQQVDERQSETAAHLRAMRWYVGLQGAAVLAVLLKIVFT